MTAPVPRQPSAPKPLTDPSDLFLLLGRLLASFVLFVLTVCLIVRTSLEHNPKYLTRFVMLTLTTALISLFVQRSTIKLWRRLRDERAAAEAERAGADTAAVATSPESKP